MGDLLCVESVECVAYMQGEGWVECAMCGIDRVQCVCVCGWMECFVCVCGAWGGQHPIHNACCAHGVAAPFMVE